MKKVLLTVLYTMICITVFSQTENNKHTSLQFTFVYPLGTNGIESFAYDNTVSINILIGISRSERVFTFGGLANIICHDATGLQFAGLHNYIGNNGKGFQFAGLANYTGKNYTGSQFAGLMNYTKDDYKGVQFAGLANYAGKNYDGFQFAGLTNYTKGDYKGTQFAGLANYAGGNYNGFRLAGLINISKNISGSQISGLINIAQKVKGLQFTGLINIADSSDYSVALINLIKNGEKSVALTYDETGSMIVSFRSGGKLTYGIAGFGYNHQANRKLFLTEGGLGIHINCSPRFRINNELKIENFMSSKYNTFKSGYSLITDYKLLAHLSVFAGASVNYMYSNDINATKLFPHNSLWKNFDSSKLQQAFVGYQFGIQYIF
ncbi:MAG: hypothetical protein LBS55_00740 [Prevotellaceae bacterium]|jgi:hypothetical protein|nr:hypothetical protein [Prevotellaceae bacterium]